MWTLAIIVFSFVSGSHVFMRDLINCGGSSSLYFWVVIVIDITLCLVPGEVIVRKVGEYYI